MMQCFVTVGSKYFDGEYRFSNTGKVIWILHEQPMSSWNTKAIAAVKAVSKQFPNETILIEECK